MDLLGTGLRVGGFLVILGLITIMVENWTSVLGLFFPLSLLFLVAVLLSWVAMQDANRIM